ncbi:MAG TPA: FHA domain-containing protein [Polyangia bacterium]|nr:FHA domain-containing protein [Polyangia bacterium]
MIACGRCGVRSSDDLFFCKECGTRLVSPEPLGEAAKQAGIAELRAAVERLVFARRAESEPLTAPPLALLPSRADPTDRPEPAAPAAPIGPRPGFRLVQLNGDGSDGPVHELGAGPVDIGRTAGNLVFDDPFLASRHARITSTAEGHMLTPLERRNGVYRRLRGPADLVAGDKILIGTQLLMFELLPDLERAAAAGTENGQAVFGSRTRPPWGRLLQLTPAGVPRDVYHLGRLEVLVGRERSDVVFSDDALISSRHARLTFHGGRTTLEDLSSLNGTFLSLRAPHVLAPGDVFRMGNEVLRFEAEAPR